MPSLQTPQTMLDFVCIKSYGDLTITAAALRLLSPTDSERCGLLIANHLSDLSVELAPNCVTKTLDNGESGVPAFFDLKRCGLRAGFISARKLRRAVLGASAKPTLVFDRISWRERYLIGKHEAVELPAANNIYAAYESFMAHTFPSASFSPASVTMNSKSLALPTSYVGIFPCSRVSAKTIPAEVVAKIVRICNNNGIDPVIVLLNGEVFPILQGVRCERILRRFDAINSKIGELHAVITADSLPAHLAEYSNRPVYVVSPKPNEYWLPASAFRGDHWGLFADADAMTESLGRFLRAIALG